MIDDLVLSPKLQQAEDALIDWLNSYCNDLESSKTDCHCVKKRCKMRKEHIEKQFLLGHSDVSNRKQGLSLLTSFDNY